MSDSNIPKDTPQKSPPAPENEPLSVEAFRDALSRMEALNLTWTADSPPSVIPKSTEAEANYGKAEFRKIQQEFPQLPREVAIAITYALTGRKGGVGTIGGEEALKQKSEMVEKVVITDDYRSEYFFKHATKVPYLSDVDWEVVLKLNERAVQGCPAVAYGIISLILQDPWYPGVTAERKMVTVAVNERSIDMCINILEELKKSLSDARVVTEGITPKSGGR